MTINVINDKSVNFKFNILKVKNPCASKACKNPGSYCEIDIHGNADCKCEYRCENVRKSHFIIFLFSTKH